MPHWLYAQYQPVADDIDWLLALQQEVAVANDRSRPMPRDQIHLTIIHFGILDEVYGQLKAVVPDSTPAQYRQAIEGFVQEVTGVMTPDIRAETRDLESFGTNGKTLVLTLETTPELEHVHRQSLAALERCFAACGLTDPRGFMSGNHNFQYALTLKPHITLLKNATQKTEITVEPKILHLQAMPILYD